MSMKQNLQTCMKGQKYCVAKKLILTALPNDDTKVMPKYVKTGTSGIDKWKRPKEIYRRVQGFRLG